LTINYTVNFVLREDWTEHSYPHTFSLSQHQPISTCQRLHRTSRHRWWNRPCTLSKQTEPRNSSRTQDETTRSNSYNKCDLQRIIINHINHISVFCWLYTVISSFSMLYTSSLHLLDGVQSLSFVGCLIRRPLLS